jgi:hypothetical protein
MDYRPKLPESEYFISTYIHTYMSTHKQIKMTYLSTSSVHTFIYIYIYIHTHTHTHIYMYTHTHTHTHTHTKSRLPRWTRDAKAARI